MNKQYYSFGNPFKIKFRNHNCFKCGTKLVVVKHSKSVSSKSPESKYYDFSIGVDGGYMMGECEFIHKIFHCPTCQKSIEFVTQIDQEDIDIVLKKVKKYYDNRGRKIYIKKYFEDQNNKRLEQICEFDFIEYLCLVIEESEKEPLIYKAPIRRKKMWERPYYFNLTKKELIKFIKKIN